MNAKKFLYILVAVVGIMLTGCGMLPSLSAYPNFEQTQKAIDGHQVQLNGTRTASVSSACATAVAVGANGCGGVSSEKSDISKSEKAVEEAAIENSKTPEPTLEPSKTPESPKAESNTVCVLDTFPKEVRFGVQLEVKKLSDTNWEFDPNTAKRVQGDSTHPELKTDASLAGCPFVIEGRKDSVEEHHIWILSPDNIRYLDKDGIFRAMEFSAWAYPSSWNVEKFGTKKASIAGEFVDAKVNNQKQNGYSWPIYVHKSDGSSLLFKAGDKVGAMLPDNCNFADPSLLNVTGIFNPDDETFDASIGAEKCFTVAKIDGEWKYWQNAKDNVVFKTIEAWLMPNSFSEEDVKSWIAKQ